MFKSILVPTDGTSLSYKPMEAAIEFARLSNGKLVILSVAEPRLFSSIETDAQNDAQISETINIKAAKSNVRKALAAADQASIPWEAVISLSHVPCEAILETAARFHCDLIVIASRGKMGVLDTLFKESTTQEVLRKTDIPVLIFPRD